MISVKKELIYDAQGHPVKVLLDYSEWQKIEAVLRQIEVEPNGHILNGFAGKIDFGGDPMEIQRTMRFEWPD